VDACVRPSLWVQYPDEQDGGIASVLRQQRHVLCAAYKTFAGSLEGAEERLHRVTRGHPASRRPATDRALTAELVNRHSRHSQPNFNAPGAAEASPPDPLLSAHELVCMLQEADIAPADVSKEAPEAAGGGSGEWLRGVFSSFLASLVEPIDEPDAAAAALARLPLAGEPPPPPPPPPRAPPRRRKNAAEAPSPEPAAGLPAVKHGWEETWGYCLSRRWRATFDEFALCLERFAASGLGRGHEDEAPADSLFRLLQRLEAAQEARQPRSGRFGSVFSASVRSDASSQQDTAMDPLTRARKLSRAALDPS